MADKVSKEKRSYIMSRVKSKDTRPEMLVRKYLYASGFRYRLHSKTLPGKPDLVLPKYKAAIFVHGCFWHNHQDCSRSNLTPKANNEYWKNKINRNVNRDKHSVQQLQELGWRTFVVWECELKKKSIDHNLSDLANRIAESKTQ
jgi:DNA mismatch endonuclease, patch repair protein